MQTASTVPVVTMRPANGYASTAMPGTVTAVQETKTALPDSTTVKLSGEAMDRYVADQETVEAKDEDAENPFKQAARKIAGNAGADGEDSASITDTLARLQEMLKEAQARLRAAQQQMAMAMAEMRSAGTDAQKMAAMMKVQSAQMMVIAAQGEVLEIHTQINKILEEEQKKTG